MHTGKSSICTLGKYHNPPFFHWKVDLIYLCDFQIMFQIACIIAGSQLKSSPKWLSTVMPLGCKESEGWGYTAGSVFVIFFSLLEISSLILSSLAAPPPFL